MEVVAPAPRTLSIVENGVIGACAGMIEVGVDQPFVAVKNALQEGRPVSLSPAVLYRGVVINAGSIAPITAVQFAVNGCTAPRSPARAHPVPPPLTLTMAER